MKLYVRYNNKPKFIAGIIILAFGITLIVLGIVVSNLWNTKSIFAVEGEYHSYRVDRYASFSGFGRSVYLTIALKDGDVKEYKVYAKAAFNEKEFLNKVNKGDDIKLIVDDKDAVIAIESNGITWLSEEDTVSTIKFNESGFVYLGSFFLLVGGVAALFQLDKKHGHYKRRKSKKF